MSGPFLASYVALWVLVGVLAFAVFALYHHLGQRYLNSAEGLEEHGPAAGTRLGSIRLPAVDGSRIEVPAGDRPAVLLFTDTACKVCATLRPAVRRFAEMQPRVRIVAVCGGPAAEVEAWAAELGPSVAVVADPGNETTTRLGVSITPFALVLDDAGYVRGKGVPNEERDLDVLASWVVPTNGSERSEAA